MNAKYSPLSLLAVLILGLFLLSGVRADTLVFDNGATNIYNVHWSMGSKTISQGFNLSAETTMHYASFTGLIGGGMYTGCTAYLEFGNGTLISTSSSGGTDNVTNFTFSEHPILPANSTPDAYLAVLTCNAMEGEYRFDADVSDSGTMVYDGAPYATNDTGLLLWSYYSAPPIPPVTLPVFANGTSIPFGGDLTVNVSIPFEPMMDLCGYRAVNSSDSTLLAQGSDWAAGWCNRTISLLGLLEAGTYTLNVTEFDGMNVQWNDSYVFTQEAAPPVSYIQVDWGTNPAQPLTITEGENISVDLICTSSADLTMGTLKLLANFSGWAANITQSNPTNGSFYNWTLENAPVGTWLLGGYCETDIWGMGPLNVTATNRTVTVEAAAPPTTTTVPAEGEGPFLNSWGVQTGNFISGVGPSMIEFIFAIGIALAVIALIWGFVEIVGVSIKHGPAGTAKAGTKIEKGSK